MTSFRRLFPLFALTALCVLALLPAEGSHRDSPGDCFRILVIDDATGRGVPLVELRTVNETRFFTDSNGIAAISDPDLLGQKIYFRISSPGYSYPKDGFGYSGVTLAVMSGQSATINIHRENIAERLYRVTGAGIYRDSMMVGQPVPIQHPLLNGQVMGQDTVEVTPYRGKLYWFFGDTNEPSYPLGQFATSGATSLIPGQGGLDPSVGVDLTYWVDSDGFSRPMIPVPNPPGPIWVSGLFTMMDNGQEHLFTRFTEINHDQSLAADGLAEFNDDKSVFEPVCFYPKDQPLRPEGHPFLVNSGGQHYLYFQPTVMGAFPLVRAIPDRKHLTDAASFEAFTCLVPGGRYQGADTPLDRAPDGHLRWGWKKDTAALGEDQANQLVQAGKMKPEERLTALHDFDTDQEVLSHGGSVFWNSYRKRWVMITTQVYGSPSFLGEVWFAEADTPVGPWTYAKKVVSHGGYTFYNPTQHPFFDQDGGRLIYFEGTYTDTYSGIKDLTPRYNYNQLMYRLALNDPRLALPAPVYRLQNDKGTARYAMRDAVAAGNRWSSIQNIPFYAIAPALQHDGLVPIYVSQDRTKLQSAPVDKSAAPLFFALSVTPASGEKTPPDVASLYEYTDAATGRIWYAVSNQDLPASAVRAAQPLCRVWRNPSSVLAIDGGAKPALMP